MIVVSSDWHPDKTTAGYQRFADVGAAVRETVDYAVREKASLYVFMGDLITNDPPLDLMIRCLQLAQEAATELGDNGIPSWWLVGNHDVFEDGLNTTVIDPISAVASALVVKRPMVLPLSGDGGLAILLPFAPLSHNYDPLAFVTEVRAQCDAQRSDKYLDVKLVLGHLMLEGISKGSETDDMPRGRDVFFPIDEVQRLFPNAICVQGHYHEQQVYRGVHVVGSLANLTRGERGNKPGFLALNP